MKEKIVDEKFETKLRCVLVERKSESSASWNIWFIVISLNENKIITIFFRQTQCHLGEKRNVWDIIFNAIFIMPVRSITSMSWKTYKRETSRSLHCFAITNWEKKNILVDGRSLFCLLMFWIFAIADLQWAKTIKSFNFFFV